MFVFEDNFETLDVILRPAKQIALEFMEAKRQTSPQRSQQTSYQQYWIPPPDNKFKVNWDVAVDVVNC